MLIFADPLTEVQRYESPPLPPSPSDFSNLLGKYGGSGEYFSTDLVQCDSASWQLLAGVVPIHRVAMDTTLPWPEVLRPPTNT